MRSIPPEPLPHFPVWCDWSHQTYWCEPKSASSPARLTLPASCRHSSRATQVRVQTGCGLSGLFAE